MAGSCGCGDELLGSIICGEFLDWLMTFRLLRKVSASLSWLVYNSTSFCLRLSHTCSITFDLFNVCVLWLLGSVILLEAIKDVQQKIVEHWYRILRKQKQVQLNCFLSNKGE
jgi:hypothetical protein